MLILRSGRDHSRLWGSMKNVEESRQGFRASLSGASLSDLIQMGCTRRDRVVYRVRSEQRVGFLFFDEGRVVDAETQQRRGEDAAFEILEWSHGSVEPCVRAWPAKATISASPQTLLLRAARWHDEVHRDPKDGGSLIAMKEHRRGGPSPLREASRPSGAEGTDADEVEMKVVDDPADGNAFAHVDEDDRIAHAALVGRDGLLRYGKGDADELGAIAAYASRLGEIIGDALELDRFEGFDARVGDQDCVMRRVGTGWGIASGDRGAPGELEWNP